MIYQAQVHAVLGAMAVDQKFRQRVWDAATDDNALRNVLDSYGAWGGLQIDQQAYDLIRTGMRSNCKDAVDAAYRAMNLAICPCWPCSGLSMPF